MYSTILVAIDGSEPSTLALNEAIKLSVALHACIRLIHVVEIWPLLTPEATAASYDLIFEKMRQDGAHLLRDAAAKAGDASVKVDTSLVEIPDAQVGESIVHNASEHQAELIVCGTHGRRGMRRLLMGSDADYIIRHARMPVLVVRTLGSGIDNSKTVAGSAAA